MPHQVHTVHHYNLTVIPIPKSTPLSRLNHTECYCLYISYQEHHEDVLTPDIALRAGGEVHGYPKRNFENDW